MTRFPPRLCRYVEPVLPRDAWDRWCSKCHAAMRGHTLKEQIRWRIKEQGFQ